MKGNVEENLYQLIIARLDGKDIGSQSYRDYIFRLVDKGIGGFIVFGGKREELREFIDKLQSRVDIPLFIASDIERGVGSQVEGYTLFPCQMAVAAAVDLDSGDGKVFLGELVEAIAVEAKDTGINMPLIPVLDVNTEPLNPIICTRAFSDNPVTVASLGKEYVRILREAGLVPCAKHFPGHGDTSVDSHITLPLVDVPMDELMNIHVSPFREVIDTGMEAIMIGHLLVPSMDDKPSSLSEKVITNFLREKLSFNGLVVTDALNMSALADIDSVFVKCIMAGVDILLHPEDIDKVAEELRRGIITGELDEDKVAAALLRIEMNKSTLKMDDRGEVDYKYHQNLSRKISENSITVLKREKDIFPLDKENKCHIFYGGEGTHLCRSLWQGVSQKLIPLEERVSEDFTGICIFLLFPEARAWKGTSGLKDREVEIIQRQIEKSNGSVIISFGSPYIVSAFKDADVIICAYDPGQCTQEAVIEVLKGNIIPRGRLPVRIDL